MDGRWNENGLQQGPEQFSGDGAAPQPGQLYDDGSMLGQTHSFSQIRQGEPYGYAAPEAIPGPAFAGDFQNPFNTSIGAVPFGAVTPDPMTGALSGGFWDSDSMPYPPAGGNGAYAAMPMQTSYAGFPPLPGSDPSAQWQGVQSSGAMQPVDPSMQWQGVQNSGAMQPVDPSMQWQGVQSSGAMQPVDPSMQWQGVQNSGAMQPVDPSAQWQGVQSSGAMQPVDPSMQWQNTGNTTGMPTVRWDRNTDPAQWQPAGDPAAMDAATQRWQQNGMQPLDPMAGMLKDLPGGDWQPNANFLDTMPIPGQEDTPLETPAFIQEFNAKAAAESEEDIQDRLNIPAYLRKPKPLPRKRPAPAAESTAPAGEQAAPAEPAGEGVPEPTQPETAGEWFSDSTYMRPAEPETDAQPEAATEPVFTEPATDTGAQPEAVTEPVFTEPVTDTEAQPEAATEPVFTEPVTDTGAQPEAVTEPVFTEPETDTGAQPEAVTEPVFTEPVTDTGAQPEAVTEPAPAEPVTDTGAQPEAVTEPAPAEPPRRTRRRSTEEKPGALRPAALDTKALERKRRFHPSQPVTEAPAAPTTEEAGDSHPFVPAAVAEDTGADAPSARPQNRPPVVETEPATQPDHSTAADSYRFLQLFQQPRYSGGAPLPGPAPDDPNVPYMDEPTPMQGNKPVTSAAPAQPDSIPLRQPGNPFAAAFPVTEDAPVAFRSDPGDFLLDGDEPFDNAIPQEPQPLAGDAPLPGAGDLQPDGPLSPSIADPATNTDVLQPDGHNPFAAAFSGQDSPQTPAAVFPGDPLPEGDPVWEEEAFFPDDAGACPEAVQSPAEAAMAQPAPIPGAQPVPDAQPLPPIPFTPMGTPYGEAFPQLSTLPESTGAQPGDEPSFGTSSYDAGDMPNPSRGNLPYDVVSAYDTGSRMRAELEAARQTQPQPEAAVFTPQAMPPFAPPQPEVPLFIPPQPEAPPQELPQEPAKAQKQPREPKPPIKPGRVLALVAAAAMVLFLLVAGGKIIMGYVQNVEDWTSFYKDFTAQNGVSINQAGEMVQLPADGSTFPPSAASVQTPVLTPLPHAAASQEGQQAQTDPSAVRTRQTSYVNNELRNILPDFDKIRAEYSEVMARLEIPGLMDEWVVQRNNTYYLNHNYRGNAEEGGAVFIDSACTLKTPPENLHLRASDSAEGKTFHKLWQYKTIGSAFATQASTATVTTLYEKLDYLLLAVFEASMDPTQPNYFNYASHPTFATDAEMMAYVTQAQQRSLYALPTDVQPGDRLLTLSTVSSTDSPEEKPVCLVLLFRHRPAW